MLPDVPPGPKTVGNVGLKLENHPAACPRRRGHQGQEAQVPRPEKGDDQQGHKEDQRRAKVTHQGQASHAEAAEEDGKNQVSPGKQPVQRGSAGKNKGNLHKLRGLESNGAKGDPVLGPENPGAQHHIENQQQAGKHGHRPAQGHRGLQVPQQQAQHQKHRDARDHTDGLGQQGLRGIGRRHGKGNGTQKKGDGLRLKGRSLQRAVEQIGPPHGRHENAKGHPDHGDLRALPVGQALHCHHDLENGQVSQGSAGAQGPLGHPPAHRLLLLLADGVERQADAAQVNDVPCLHRHGVGDFLSVEPGSVLGLQGLEFPAPLVVPQQGRMAAGDGGKIQTDIRPSPPSNGVLPMAQVQTGPISQGEPPPDFLSGFLPEQGH